MAHFSPEHFSGTVRTTKDDLRYGPLKWRRVNTLPPNTYGRNGDFVIVDDTAIENENAAISRTPVDVALCQKIPFVVTAGDFTVTTASGVFTIDITTLDDFVDAINRAAIPELRVEYTDPKSPEGGNNFLLHANSVTFLDGTSDLPSVLGLAVVAGDLVVATGSWQCFPVGSTGVDVSSSGVPVAPGGFTELNFTGPGVSSIVDAGGGTVTITISGGGAGGVAYGAITGDVGVATATAASENVTFGGVGVTITATDAGAGLDTVSFDLDIADLPAGPGPVVLGDTIAINQGGTTLEYPLSSLSSLFGGLAYGVITGGDGGSAVASVASDTITINGTGINVMATNGISPTDSLDLVLDISDLPIGAGPLTATDTIAVNDGGTTEQHTIEDVVDAALPGLTITTINGQPMLTLEDTTRANKILSVAEQTLAYAENALGPGDDWLRIANANDIDSGYIMDFDGTLVYATVHCEDGLTGAKDLRLFINAADNGVILTVPGALNGTDADETLNIDFAQGDRLRIRADTGGGNTIGDTVVKLTVKWRG